MQLLVMQFSPPVTWPASQNNFSFLLWFKACRTIFFSSSPQSARQAFPLHAHNNPPREVKNVFMPFI
jgi:hypothetical protein